MLNSILCFLLCFSFSVAQAKEKNHDELIKAINSNNINSLLALKKDYPWLDNYFFDLLQTDLSFMDQITDSEDKVVVLEKLLDRTSFAPVKKIILEKTIELKDKLKLSSDELKKTLAEMLDENIDTKNCRANFTKAKRFRDFRKFDLSLKLFEASFACSKENKDQLSSLNEIVTTHKLKERGQNFIKASERHYNFARQSFKTNNLTAAKMNTIGITHARTLWTYKSSEAAEAVLNELSQILKSKISFQTIYWIRARLEEERKNLSESLKYIDLALNEKNLNLEDYLSLFWQKFWDNYKSDNLNLAEQTLRSAIKIEDPDDGRSKLYYWLLRLLHKKDPSEEVKKEIAEIEQTLLNKYPLSFYSALIRKDKNVFMKNSNLEDLSSKAYKSLPASFDLKLYKELHQASIPVTQAYLKSYYNEHKNSVSKEQRFLVKRLMSRNGDILNLFLDVKAKPELCTEEASPCMDLFPSPYKNHTLAAEKRFNIPNELIYSIIRQESIFNPLAKSWADARGLMQLLPSLAKELAPKIKVNYESSLDLYHPEKNILLGAFHLKNLFNENLKSTVLALSGYNADKRKSMVWYKTRFKGDWLEFIEEIPYKETRNYNKLVLRNFIIYSSTDKEKIKQWLPKGL